MAIVYFDASALVKLLIEEPGTELAVELWDGCDAAFASRLAYPEVRAALAAAHRNGTISAAQLAETVATWDEFWSSMRPVELTEAVEQHAGALTERDALRGADAVHLASALQLVTEDLVVAVWDRRLHAACLANGLTVVPVDPSASMQT